MLVSRLSAPSPSSRRAVGAMSGQISQALASFALQVAAAHTMGPAGLGLFAFLFGAIGAATAVSTGMVGDSMTVLDRQKPLNSARRCRAGACCWPPPPAR